MEAGGGFECSLVDEASDGLLCPICLLPCREPHLISCCGKKACHYCISRIEDDDQPCPCCRSVDFATMIDRDVERRVLSLRVYCKNKENGCTWTGELRQLETHSNSCLHSYGTCKYNCGLHCSRNDLAIHERDDCELRPEVVLSQRIESMARDLSKLETKCEQQDDELEEQRETIRRLRGKIRTQETLIRENEEQLQIVLRANDEVNDKLHTEREKREDLTSRNDFLEREVLKYKRRLKTMRNEIIAVLNKEDEDFPDQLNERNFGIIDDAQIDEEEEVEEGEVQLIIEEEDNIPARHVDQKQKMHFQEALEPLDLKLEPLLEFNDKLYFPEFADNYFKVPEVDSDDELA